MFFNTWGNVVIILFLIKYYYLMLVERRITTFIFLIKAFYFRTIYYNALVGIIRSILFKLHSRLLKLAGLISRIKKLIRIASKKRSHQYIGFRDILGCINKMDLIL